MMVVTKMLNRIVRPRWGLVTQSSLNDEVVTNTPQVAARHLLVCAPLVIA